MINLGRGIKKALFFAVAAVLGCLLAAGFGEILLAFTLPPPQSTQVDVMFVLDVTGSMKEEINGVQKGIDRFVSELSSRKLDARVGLMAFGDRSLGEESQTLSFSGQAFTNDSSTFSREMGSIQMVGGGDDPESSLDAVVLATRQPFRPQATKVILLITDAPPKIPDRETASIEAAAQVLRQQQISQLHLVIQDRDRPAFVGLQSSTPGQIFSLAETASGRQGFDRLLPEVSKQIAAIATSQFSPDRFPALLLATSLWTGVLAIGVFLALIFAQNFYLRRPIWEIGRAIPSTLGSLAAGLAAGAIGQLPLYEGLGSLVALQIAGRILAWTLLGGLLGWGMAFFVPNLHPRRALLGGGVGGAVGAVGFLGAASAFGDIVGRLLGAAILGFFIGLAIAFIEVAFRKAWLEIAYGPKEIRSVNLGAEPISIGSNAKACTIYASNAPPIALRYRLDRGQILCEDVATGVTQPLQPGDYQRVGNLTVAVRSAEPAEQLVDRDLDRSSPKVYQDGRSHPQPQSQFSLHIKRQVIPLTNGTRLSTREIPGLEPQSADGVVAQVNPNPKDPSVLGLQNCSHRAWTVTLASGEQRQVESGRSIKLAAGTKIKFGSIEGEIR